MNTLTPQQILDLPMLENDAGAATIREYLIALLDQLLMEGEGFSGKRPFGNSGWEYDLFKPLIKAGAVAGELDSDGYVDEVDQDEAHKLIEQAVDFLRETPAASVTMASDSDLLEQAWGIIANAYGGNWEYSPPAWASAAKDFRTKYHNRLDAISKSEFDTDAARIGLKDERMLKFFQYDHLPPHLQEVSKPFCELAANVCLTIEPGPERTVALRKLLEGKDAAVRATLNPGD